MNLSDLLKMDAVNEQGERLGHVHDVRFTSSNQGPTGWSAAALLVGRSGFTARLGYAHGEVRGPWLLRTLTRALDRHGKEIPWDRVVAVEEGRIVVSGAPDEFPHPSESRSGDQG